MVTDRQSAAARRSDDSDSPWRDALTRYLPEFLAFYFPAASEAIDWSQPPVFLDQELAQVVRDAELGRRCVDRLVQVATRQGGQEWVYIHIEVQAQSKRRFAERLFVYNYRLYDRYRRPVATLAVLADGRPRWRPHSFGYELFGCRHVLEFPTVKLLDWAGRLEELLVDPNPFALVTAAHLLTQQTKKDMAARYAAKWRLAKLLYQRDWDKQRILDLFAILDWMLTLPKGLERQLWTALGELEEEAKMPYVTSVQRIGRREGESKLLRRQLVRRFGALPAWAEDRLAHAPVEQLEAWADRLLEAGSLAEVLGPAEA